MRKLSWRQIISYIGIWILIAILFSMLVYFSRIQLNPEAVYTWRTILYWQSIIYGWAILFPAIKWFAIRFRSDRGNWKQTLPIHLVGAFLFISVQIFLTSFTYHFCITSYKDENKPFIESLRTLALSDWLLEASVYLVILSTVMMRDYSRRFHGEQLKNSELKAALAHSELSALKMQLHPHFLFNTLNSISTLLHKDARAADEMVARLGDFLRLTLENSGEQVVTLAQEMDFINRYLEIESIRFGDRLTLEREVEPETLQARVPNLILQPLIENAIKHGISRQIRPGKISIRARRFSEKLQLEIEDDGPGLQNGKSGSGIGLANTRARLFNLYGDNQQVEIARAAPQGLIVKLEIPFETDKYIIEQ